MYQKLLAPHPDGLLKFTIEDLIDVSPEMGRSLLQLLEFEGDVENTFCREFVATYECFGSSVVVPLQENGENIPVTSENRGEFVEKYIDWYFNESIKDKFRSFKKGFSRCMAENSVPDNSSTADASSSANSSNFFAQQQSAAADKSGGNVFLSLFRPSELELLICGNEVLDFESYRANTEYQDGYDKESPIVGWFWEIVLGDLTEEEKRELLAFITGSSRAPPKGLGAAEARLTIGRMGPDSDSLPTAHTCFNHLLIPEYSDKDKLRVKLLLAVKNNQGFGLI